MSFHRTLADGGAPRELAERVEREALDFAGAWEACADPAERLWLAACARTPIAILLEAMAAVLEEIAARFGHEAGPLIRAAEVAAAGASADELAGLAERAESLARRGPESYRGAPMAGFAHLAEAAAMIVHAAEGLVLAETHREAGRLEQARATGTQLGIGTHAVLPRHPGPLRLSPETAPLTPAESMVRYAVAALSEASHELALALLEREPDAKAVADARAAVDTRLREDLEDEGTDEEE